MVSKFFKQAAGFLNKRKHDRQWMMVFCCMAILVVLGTVTALRMTGKALTNKEQVLNCAYTFHEHTEDCYDSDDLLICGMAGYAVHVHTEDCYDPDGVLVCPLPEREPHEHTEDCYEEQELLICDKKESEDLEGHVHTEDCYVLEQTEPMCGQEEHIHTEDCYETMLTCAEEEHIHEDGCYEEDEEGVQELVCSREDHEHTDGCYEREQICGVEEHSHTEDCCGTEKILVCEKEEEEETEGHTHNEECYERSLVLACGELELHTHEEEECYDEEGRLICERLVLEEHIHGEECFQPAAEASIEEIIEAEEETILTKEFCQEYQDGILTVVASYEKDAEIPEDAELIVVPITEESDEAAYKERMETAKELSGRPLPSVELLYSIGFYVDGVEIEPKGTVNIEFRIFQEGISTGDPVTVVHFGEEEPVILESTDMMENEDGSLSTSFDSDSFSPFAILVGGEEEKKQTGYIHWEQTIYAQADKESDSFCLAELENKPEEMIPVEIQNTIEDEDGVNWCQYTVQTEDELLQQKSEEYPYIPEADVIVEGNFTKRILTAMDENGIRITVEGYLPEEAELSITRIYDPDIKDLTDQIQPYMQEFDPGFFRLVYKMDLGCETALPNPVTVKICDFDLQYDDFANLHSWIYQIDSEEDQVRAERIEAEIGKESGITFQTDHLSTIYAAADLLEGREEYIRFLMEYWENEDDILEENTIVDYLTMISGTEEVDSEEENEEELAVLESVLFNSVAAVSRAALPSSEQIEVEGGTTKDADDQVEISKTINGTNLENVFDITLTVKAPTDSKKLYEDPDVAVVIVLDVSNTMKEPLGKTTRYEAAVSTAEAFINKFYTQCSNGNSNKSRIGFVTFNTNARKAFGLQTCRTEKKRDDLIGNMKESIDKTINAANYDESHNRFTNIEGGLKLAKDMLQNVNNENKCIILITDGFPTTYLKNNADNSTDYTGYDPYNKGGKSGTEDGVFYDRVLNKDCSNGVSYSDKAAIRARKMANKIKKAGIEIYSIGVGIGEQTIKAYIDKFNNNKTLAIVDRNKGITGDKFEIGSAEDKEAYKEWLRNSIGSGYYKDVSTKADLTAGFTDILGKIVVHREKVAQSVIKVEDPIPFVNNVGYVEFIGFYNKSETLQLNTNGTSKNLTGTYESGGENTVSFASNKINWKLNQSGYSTKKSGTITTYTYTLKYRVRLKNETASFVENNIYNTNGITKLTYKTVTTINGKNTSSVNKTLEFKIPSVRGYLSELQFTKTDRSGGPIEGAEFTLAHDTVNCKFCRGDGKKAVSISSFRAVSDKNGMIAFKNIPSGHQYTLKETKVPDGYESSGETYTVKVAYNEQTITVQNPDGTTGTWSGTVVNKARVGLPETGSFGGEWYHTAGIICLIIGTGLLYRKRSAKGGKKAS